MEASRIPKSSSVDSNLTNTGSVNTKIKLSPWRKVAYALADGGNNLSYSFVISFLMFFATDVYGVGAAAIGTVILVSRIFDAVTDPLIGGISDKTRSRWGVYRPWIIFAAIPLVIINTLTFTTMPFATELGKTIYICSMFMILVIVYSCVNIPYSAMTASLTQDTDERASLSTYRLFVAVTFSSFVIGTATLPLVNLVGQGDLAKGFFWTSVLYGAVALLLYFISFLGTKEVVVPKVEKQSFKEMFGSMKGNTPAWILSLGFLIMGLFFYGRASTYAYYFTYNAGDMNLLTAFSLFFGVGALIGVVLVPIIGSRVSNKGHLPLWGFFIGGILLVLVYFIDPTTQWNLFIILNIAIAALLIGAQTMMYGMVPDTVEYGEHKTGIRAAGFISSFINFFLKLGMAVGTSGVAFLLAYFGYQAGADQPMEVLTAINLIMNLVPGILSVITGLVFIAYKLDKKTYYNLVSEIDEKSK